MSGPVTRIGRFVRAARSLLLMQLAAAGIAVALSVWAVLAVRDLATERDELRARVAQLETQAPANGGTPSQAPAGPSASPLDNEVRPPTILPIPIPVTGPASEPEVPEPTEPGAPPDPATGEPGATTPPEQDCSGANARLPRCRRPGRWNPRDPVPQRPVPPVRGEPLQPPVQRQPVEREPTPQ